MSDETDRSPVSGSDEIIDLIKEQQALEPEFNYRDYKLEDYFALGVFWILALMVFSQFLTRYLFRFSFPWTEEGARYLLVCITFLGSVMAVRRNTHIYVEFLYRYLPRKTGRILITIVDVIRVVFLVVLVRLGIAIMPRTMNNFLSTVRIPLAAVYFVATFGMALMLWRAVEIGISHWKEEFVPSSREDRRNNPETTAPTVV